MLCLAMVCLRCGCEWKRKRRNARKGARERACEGKRPRSDAQGEVKMILPVPEKCPNRVSGAAVAVGGAVAVSVVRRSSGRSPRPLPPTPAVRGGDDAMEGGFLGDEYMDECDDALPASATRTTRMLSVASNKSGYTAVGDDAGDVDGDDAV